MHTINGLSWMKNLLTEGQALLYTVYDTISNLPIGYLKFYYDGVFTTTPTSTVITGPLNQLKFVPTQLMSVTEIIPSSTAVTQNQMLVESSKRRSLGVVGIQRLIDVAVARAIRERHTGSDKDVSPDDKFKEEQQRRSDERREKKKIEEKKKLQQSTV